MTSPHQEPPASQYVILVNDEGQYSLWPQQKNAPPGWRKTGPEGSKEACLDYVTQVWSDITPLSVRKKLVEIQ